MTKHFCDRCGDELSITTATGAPGFDGERIPIGTGFSTATAILISKDGPGVLCLHCVLDAIATLDDRPKLIPTGMDAQGMPIDQRGLPHVFVSQALSPSFCELCGRHESHVLHADTMPTPKGAAVEPHAFDGYYYVGSGLELCKVCGQSESHPIHGAVERSVAPSPMPPLEPPHEFQVGFAYSVSGGPVICAFCGQTEDHPIHKKPEVQNPPSLFGGPVKE